MKKNSVRRNGANRFASGPSCGRITLSIRYTTITSITCANGFFVTYRSRPCSSGPTAIAFATTVIAQISSAVTTSSVIEFIDSGPSLFGLSRTCPSGSLPAARREGMCSGRVIAEAPFLRGPAASRAGGSCVVVQGAEPTVAGRESVGASASFA